MASPAQEEAGLEPAVYDDPQSIRALAHVRSGGALGPYLVARAAEEDGAAVQWFGPNMLMLSFEGRRVLHFSHQCDESEVGRRLLRDKHLTKRFLTQAGIATPEGGLARTRDEAVGLFLALGRPVVVKPRSGHGSRGVSVDVRNEDDVVAAYKFASPRSRGVIVEELIDGPEYRCHTSEHAPVSVTKRLLPNVVGDGQATIRELIDRKNAVRRKNPYLYNRPIPVDDMCVSHLTRNGLTLDSVPADGEFVTVRNVGGASNGSDTVQCLETVDPAVPETALQTVAAVPGIRWLGADMMVDRASGKPYVLELNANPAISTPHYPVLGRPRDVAGHIWQLRKAKAAPDPQTEPATLPMNQPARAVGQAHAALWERQEPVRLSTLFSTALTQRGYQVTAFSPRVTKIVDQNGREEWLSACTTTADLGAVVRIVRRHRLVRGLLKAAEVPQVDGARVRTAEDLQTFMRQTGSPAVLVSAASGWGSGRRRRVRRVENVTAGVLSGVPEWTAQARPPGDGVTVCADNDRALAVLGGTEEVSNHVLQATSDVAVRAVRAVPGLRWAAVDVVVPSDQSAHGSALAQGMTLNPRIRPSRLLLAGSLDAVFDRVLDAA